MGKMTDKWTEKSLEDDGYIRMTQQEFSDYVDSKVQEARDEQRKKLLDILRNPIPYGVSVPIYHGESTHDWSLIILKYLETVILSQAILNQDGKP